MLYFLCIKAKWLMLSQPVLTFHQWGKTLLFQALIYKWHLLMPAYRIKITLHSANGLFIWYLWLSYLKSYPSYFKFSYPPYLLNFSLKSDTLCVFVYILCVFIPWFPPPTPPLECKVYGTGIFVLLFHLCFSRSKQCLDHSSRCSTHFVEWMNQFNCHIYKKKFPFP